MHFLDRFHACLPIVQAPMAGVSTPAMAAAVSNSGGLGSLGVGATDAAGAARMIQEFRERSRGPLHVNVFCHEPARADPEQEAAWIARLQPHFASFGASPPTRLETIYRSFLEDESMVCGLAKARPDIVSFHFGIPPTETIRQLHAAGIALVATVTCLAEGRRAANSGIDAVIAQGYEAGGHRGMIDLTAQDDQLGVLTLTRLLVRELDVPVIAAGGIMDGSGVAAVLRLGAGAAQLGTAFIACPESAADSGYRNALMSEAAHHTTMTRVISGRPARCLANRFTRLGAGIEPREIPAYPIAYDVGKALHAVAKASGEFGYGAQWAGQGAPLARSMPAAELVATLSAETRL